MKVFKFILECIICVLFGYFVIAPLIILLAPFCIGFIIVTLPVLILYVIFELILCLIPDKNTRKL